MSKIRATACILTKNEEDNLPKCLAPLRDFEEIIVYDSGSTDKTVEVAQKFGATVIEGAWEDFGSTRYRINRISWIGGKRFRHGNWYPDWNLRLFRRTAWSMEERDVHESVEIEGAPGRFFSRLEHHSYKDWNERKTRASRYAKLWASQAFRDGRRDKYRRLRKAWDKFGG